ncbi:MAG: right-handed parallel beta-helix repeat-containing protein [bacterium]|nr:right-handed parallel beta-helix repeat-containing protein [bacterium]
MPHVMSHLLYVSATDTTAACTTISTALRHANAGDTVLVGPGQYSPSRTNEAFPLYVPPGVTLLGSGQDDTIVDGEGAMGLSFRPVLEGNSLVLLGDGSTLSGFTLLNSGGNGIGNQPGARIQVTRNTIRQHGQHGIILSGPQEAIIKDNTFLDNGTQQFRPLTPRPAAGRQGHHIFVQGKSGAANRILICDNSMTRAFADGIAIVVFFDEADGVQMHVRVLNNTIEQSERRGLTIAGSFGPCHNRVTIDVCHNTIRNNNNLAIGAQTARPLVTQCLRDNHLRLNIIDNACHNNGDGIMLYGGFGPAADNVLDAAILQNHITGAARYGLRIIGGVGMGGYGAHRNRVQAVLSRNCIENAGEVPIFLQGGATEGQEEVTGNAVVAQVIDNDLPTAAGKPSLLLNDGLADNTAQLEEPTADHERVQHVLPYEA